MPICFVVQDRILLIIKEAKQGKGNVQASKYMLSTLSLSLSFLLFSNPSFHTSSSSSILAFLSVTNQVMFKDISEYEAFYHRKGLFINSLGSDF